MNRSSAVAVCSRSFSAHPVLRSELLARYEHVTFNDAGLKLAGASLVTFLRGHDKAIVALETIDASVLNAVPELRVVSKYGVGLDTIDKAALSTAGVRLGWTAGVNCRSVAELALSFAIALLRGIPQTNREVRAGTWRQYIGRTLSGRTVGIIGCGHVGKDLVRLLQPFGCRVLSYDIRAYQAFYSAFGVQACTLEDLLREAEVISVHTPLDHSTRRLLDAERLRLVRPAAVLVNTARGGIVDEKALKQMLTDGRISGAAFDVFESEPPTDRELLDLPNFLSTPHIGGSADEAIVAMGRAAIDGLDENEIPAD